LLIVNGDKDLQVTLGRCLTIGEACLAWFNDKFATEADSLAGTVLGEDLWNEYSKVVSGDSHIQVLREQVGDIERVTGGECGLECSGHGILSQVSLTIFAFWITDVESGWCGGWCFNMLRIKEGAIDAHLENVGIGELWAADLGVVSSDTAKIWNLFLAAIDLEILVNLCVDGGDGSGLNLLDQLWDHGVLEKWDENVGDLGDESTSKSDVDIVWRDIDGEFVGFKLWSELVTWRGLLSACVKLDVDGSLLDLDISLTINGDEAPLVVEVRGQLSLPIGNCELGTIACMLELHDHISWHWLDDFHIDVFEVASIEVDLWDADVADVLENIRNNDMETGVDTILSDGHADTWSLSGWCAICGK
jgi:hypothetical protein